MSKGATTISHEYDPNVVFHSHSTNMPHLNSWVDDLIHMTENALPARDHPTTEQLVEALHRYDSVFRELIRQTVIHSEPLTRMYTKTWVGTLKLLDYMVKAYHRYVKHTTHLQDQAASILKDKRGQMAAALVREEEHELERTALRAKIRNLQAEVDVQKGAIRGLETENAKLRTVVDVYIHAQELNEAVWETMDADEEATHESVMGDDPPEVPIRKHRTVDAGKNQLATLCRLDVEMNELISGVLKEESRQLAIVSELGNTLQTYKGVFGEGHMTANGWRGGKGELISTREAGVQVDEKNSFGCVLDSIPSPREELFYDVLPVAPVNIIRRGASFPFKLRQCMTSFPRVLRIPTVEWTCQSILAIYFEKIRTDQALYRTQKHRESLPEFVYTYFRNMYGLEAVADVQCAQLMKAVESHMTASQRVALFASMMGVYDKESSPGLDLRDTDFVLSIIAHLVRLGELVPEKAVKNKKVHAPHSHVVKTDVKRENAVLVAQTLFEHWTPDGGADYVTKLNTRKSIALDDLVEILMELWHIVRFSWEDHLRYLYKQYCSCFRVTLEAMFENDETENERDSVLMEVSKEAMFDSLRRPIRLFMKKSEAAAKAEAGDKDSGKAQGNPNKEPVAEAMRLKDFYKAVNAINKDVSKEQMDVMFEEACVWSHQALLRCLEFVWFRCQDERGRDYYFNTMTSKSQWSKPYHTKTFVCSEIEVDAFVYIMLSYDIIPQSQFVELMHVSPKDLWPNADVFLKQLAATAHKKKTKLLKKSSQQSRAGGTSNNSVGSESSYGTSANHARGHKLDGLEGKTGAALFEDLVVPALDMKEVNQGYEDPNAAARERDREREKELREKERDDERSVGSQVSQVTLGTAAQKPGSSASAGAESARRQNTAEGGKRSGTAEGGKRSAKSGRRATSGRSTPAATDTNPGSADSAGGGSQQLVSAMNTAFSPGASGSVDEGDDGSASLLLEEDEATVESSLGSPE